MKNKKKNTLGNNNEMNDMNKNNNDMFRNNIFGNRPAVCCVPHAIDQDPYFRLARDVAPKMNLIKPTNIMCSFIPPITGSDGKMSSSKADATIFLTDDKETLKKKTF